VGWVDLQAHDVAETLAALQARPGGGYLRGIRHPVLIERDPDWLRRPAVHRGLSAVGQAGLCYDFVVPPDVLPAVIDAAAACPDTTFVLDHLGNPDFGEYTCDRWVRAIRRLGGFQNVFCKLSGILGEPPPGQAVPVLEDTLLEDTAPDVRHLRPYRCGARRVRPGPADVRLGLAALHAGCALWHRRRRSQGPHRRPQPVRADRCALRHGAAGVPAELALVRPMRGESSQ